MLFFGKFFKYFRVFLQTFYAKFDYHDEQVVVSNHFISGLGKTNIIFLIIQDVIKKIPV